jgi:5-methylcytosine-specific restriction endonuclease McrA
LTREQWHAICEEYGQRCAYCGELRPLTIDHVYPISLGGSHSPENVVPACLPCNQKKGAKVIAA